MVKYAVTIDAVNCSYAITELTACREETLGGQHFLTGEGRPLVVWSAEPRATVRPAGGVQRFHRSRCFDTLDQAYAFLNEHKGPLMQRIKDRTRRAGQEIKECNRRIRAKRAEVRELWQALKALSTLRKEEVEPAEA
jgi:hypothetical protein